MSSTIVRQGVVHDVMSSYYTQLKDVYFTLLGEFKSYKIIEYIRKCT